MVDDQVLLPDRGKAVAGVIADALGEARIVRHEFKIGPVDGQKLRKLAQRQHAFDHEHLVVSHGERALHKAPKLGGHCRFHFEADHRAAAAALQRALEQAHQVFRLFFHFDVGIADHAERALALHGVAGEQPRDEQAARLFERHDPRRPAFGDREADEALDFLRHADQRVHRLAVFGAMELEGDRKAEVRDERERMRRIDRERRQHREDVLEEVVFEPGAVGLLQAVAFHEHDVRGLEFVAKLPPAGLLVGGEARYAIADLCKLLARREPVRAPGRDALAHLRLEARDADHEELVEVVGGDRKEPDLLEQRVLRVFGLLQDPAVEMQPGQLPVDEPLRAGEQVGDGVSRARHRRGSAGTAGFCPENNILCVFAHVIHDNFVTAHHDRPW